MNWTKWATDSTTIQGASLLFGTLAAELDGKMGWQAGVPVILGALGLIIWPQNHGLQQQIAANGPAISAGAGLLVGDIEKVVAAYNMGQVHQAEKQALLTAPVISTGAGAAFTSLTKGA